MGSAVFCEVGFAHVALFLECGVERECGLERHRGLSGSELEVIPEKLLIHGVGAVLDDCFGTLHGIFVAQVGDTLIGDDDVDRVLCVVDMGHMRHDVAYQALLGD